MAEEPTLNLELTEVNASAVLPKSADKKAYRKTVVVIVSMTLLLNSTMSTVIVPIIVDYLRENGVWNTHVEFRYPDRSPPAPKIINGVIVYGGQYIWIGLLFASKALVQLMINPFSGALVDRVGCEKPMIFGIVIMFLSTTVFALGTSFAVLIFARILQGVGSAFADTSGLAMIADRYTEKTERTKVFGVALAFRSFGYLVTPLFCGLMYTLKGKEPFLIFSLVYLIDGIILCWITKRIINEQQQDQDIIRPIAPPIWILIKDPYIITCAGAIIISNISLSFLEPTISVWMMQWKQGMIWLPAFLPHLLGIIFTVMFAKYFPKYQYLIVATGIVLQGVSSLIIPFATGYWVLMIPISFIFIGNAFINTIVLPTLGHLVDVKYVSVYGTIYAIAEIAYLLPFSFAPLIAVRIMESFGFLALNIGICITTLVYVPVVLFLRHIYDTDFEDTPTSL